MIEDDTNSASRFFRAVRDFSLSKKPWDSAIHYDIKPDEAFNLPLISFRVYGNYEETIVVQACTGTDIVDIPIPQETFVFPDSDQLHDLKVSTGFESLDEQRDGKKPAWLEYYV